MNRRGFVASLAAALPAFMFGLFGLERKAEAEAPPAPPVRFKDGPSGDWPPPDPTPMDHERIYTDLETMFKDIAAHTRETGDVILSADNPLRFPPTMGFWAVPAHPNTPGIPWSDVENPGRGWSIPIARLARALKALEEKPDPHENDRPGLFQPDPFPASPRTKAKLLRHYLKTADGRKLLARSFPGQRQ